MSSILVSFVIPVLNGENVIGRCLSSIQSQKWQDGEYEVIVLDNGSTDKTREIISDMGFGSEVIRNVHVGALRNRGAKMAKGCYVAFLDSDIEIKRQWIERALMIFGDQEVLVCGCFPSIPNGATWVEAAWSVHVCSRHNHSGPYVVAWIGSASLIVRRDAFLEIGGFNESLRSAEDVDFCYRISKRGKVICNPSMHAVHWGGDHDLPTFWKKEVWRGLGTIPGIRSHGFRWDELPSISYPVYVLALVLLLCFGGLIDFWNEQILMVPISLFLLMVPPLCLVGRTTWLAKDPHYFPHLFLLYSVYGFARAYGMIKSLELLIKEKNDFCHPSDRGN